MHNISRRSFLKNASVGLATFAIARNGFAANEKLSHACIGVGGMGAVDLNQLRTHPKVDIVAICDVDRDRLDKAAALVPNARKYTDWRELIAKEGNKIDSINAAVPDHMHAAITMTALHAKKHVYCQKPLTHDVAESRAVARAAKAAGVVTQLGTQAASGIGDRMAVEMIREGVIGKVTRAILCSNRPGAIETYRLKGPRPEKGEPAPSNLAWDLWLGTAPERPFAPSIYHPTKWRAWQDFGTGWSGDIGCHIFSAVWKGLGLTAPKSIIAEVQKSWEDSPERRADTWPQGDHVTWIFPGNKLTGGKDLILEWFDGEMYPAKEIRDLAEHPQYPAESSMLIGTDGALLLQHGAGPVLLPSEKFKTHPRPKLPPQNHYHNFADACLGTAKAESDFSFAGPMAEAILLGTVAIRVPNTLLKWNAANMTFPNAPKADKLVRRTYRDGWKIAGL